ncbi:TPA-induced transmembrane protein homolog [Xenentodon cancila]
MDFELEVIAEREGAQYLFDKSDGNEAAAAGEDGVDHMDPDVTESLGLVSGQIPNGNGKMTAMGTEGQQNGGGTCPSHEVFKFSVHQLFLPGFDRVKNSLPLCGMAGLNERVYRGVRLWMFIPLIIFIFVVVIIVTFTICSAIHVDEDEQFDRSLFKIPRHFNGSFNISFNASYNESQVSADLQQQVADLYRSSHALGRYFSQAEIYALRNNSVEYKLTFVLPEEDQEELRNFILSREMVHNMFRQFLYDRDPVEPGRLSIDKASLKMSSGYMTDVYEQTQEKA